MTRTTARQRTFGAVAAVVVALLALSACGAGGSGVASAGGEANPAATEDAAPLDADAQALAFAECIRDNGVDMPDPAPGQRGLFEAFQHEDVQDEDQETIDEALAACQDLAPQFEHGDEAGHERERSEMMLELADCLREQGIDDVPDDLEGIGHEDLDDEFTAALEQCRNELGFGQ